MFHHVKLPACCEPPATDPALLEDVDLLDLEAHVALQHDAMARGDALHNDLPAVGGQRMPWEMPWESPPQVRGSWKRLGGMTFTYRFKMIL